MRRPRLSRLAPRPSLAGLDPTTHVLLLDVDGVLVTPPDWFGVRLLRENRAVTQHFFETAFRSASTGKSDLREHLPAFIAARGRADTPDAFLRAWLESENHPDPALLGAVRELREQGWRTFLATNQEAHRTRFLLTEGGLGDVADGHFASCAVGHRKPEAAYYAEVTRRLEVEPRQIVFWDDNAANVDAARAAGWTAQPYTGVQGFRRAMGL